MKTKTKALALVLACIAPVTAAVFAATPQKPEREPHVFTLKANGKAVAVMTLDILNDGAVEITSSERTEWRGKEGERGTARIQGGVKVRFRGERAEFDIKTDEVQVDVPAPSLPSQSPRTSKRQPQVFTLKADGKAVAVLTLDVLSNGPLEISSESMQIHGNPGERGTGRFKGGMTMRVRGERAEVEIKTEEVQMEMAVPK